MVTAFGQDAPHIFALLGSPMPSLPALRAIFAAWRARGTGWVADTARLLVASPREWLDENFESEKLKAMMAVWGMHLDFSPDCAGGALFPYLESMANQCFGMALGRGGADTIVTALLRAIAAEGGEVRLGAPVRSIAVEAGAAKGVVLQGGERIEATRAVIANLHPRVLFGDLMPASSPAAQRLAKLRPGPATMMIHLALNDLPAWSAGAALRRFAYVHLAPSFAAMATTYTEALAGLLPAEPALVVGQPTAIDPSRAPDGRHVLWVQVRVLPSRIRGDAARSMTGTDWDSVKEAYADRVIGIIERYAPGLTRKHPRPRRALPRRSRARQSQSHWRRQPRRQSPPRSELHLPAGLRLVALPHADRTPLYGRRLDLARRRHRRRFGLHAGESAGRSLTSLVNFLA